jgi:hypothetical protein
MLKLIDNIFICLRIIFFHAFYFFFRIISFHTVIYILVFCYVSANTIHKFNCWLHLKWWFFEDHWKRFKSACHKWLFFCSYYKSKLVSVTNVTFVMNYPLLINMFQLSFIITNQSLNDQLPMDIILKPGYSFWLKVLFRFLLFLDLVIKIIEL